MLAIGVESIDLQEFTQKISQRDEDSNILESGFSEMERKRCFEAKQSIRAFAEFFAAKMALAKALPGLTESIMDFMDLSVSKNSAGEHKLALSGKALLRFQKSGAKNAHLSLSQIKDNIVAFVVVH